MKFIFTSEAVTEGHPDKVADRIADSILDEILKQDPMARVACECVTAPELVFIFGEITTNAHVDYEKIARDTVKEIGYTKKEYGFDYKNMKVVVKMGEQSPNIALGVDTGGAGDQGIMFGYATSETDDFMPLPIHLAQALAKRLTEVRKNGTIPYLRPDGKTQVSIEYEGRKPLRCSTVLISAQTDPNVSLERIKKDLKKYVIREVIPEYLLKDSTRILVNPTGKFIVGGPAGDTGLTGRKIIVDTYGGVAHHGGGAFSGKDPTKVDRSATYMARYIAKNIVASGIALRCEIQLSYGIGIAEPISIYVDTFGTGRLTAKRIVSIIKKEFDLTPTGIINKLELRNPIYKNVSVYGHFGRLDLDLPWERLDKVDDLKKYIQ